MSLRVFFALWLGLVCPALNPQETDWSIQIDPCSIGSFEYGREDEAWCRERWAEQLRSLLIERFTFPQVSMSARYTLGGRLTEISPLQARIEIGEEKRTCSAIRVAIHFFLNDGAVNEDVLEKEVHAWAASSEAPKDLRSLKERATARVLAKIRDCILEKFPHSDRIRERKCGRLVKVGLGAKHGVRPGDTIFVRSPEGEEFPLTAVHSREFRLSSRFCWAMPSRMDLAARMDERWFCFFCGTQPRHDEEEQTRFELLCDLWQDDIKASRMCGQARVFIGESAPEKQARPQVFRLLGTPEPKKNLRIEGAFESPPSPGSPVRITFRPSVAGHVYILNVMADRAQMIFPLVGCAVSRVQAGETRFYPPADPRFPFDAQKFTLEEEGEVFLILLSERRIRTLDELLDREISRAQAARSSGRSFELFVPLLMPDMQELGEELMAHRWGFFALRAGGGR